MSQKKQARALFFMGLAAFTCYQYSRLSNEQKRDLFSSIKEIGRKLYGLYVPQHVKNLFNTNNDLINYEYGENSDYPG